MGTNYRASFGVQFQKEFVNYPLDQKKAVYEFVQTYQEHGLGNFSRFQGKIAASWRNATPEDEAYAREHNLWHYHVGLPIYEQSPYGDYMTSDWLLHFKWDSNEHIILVDIFQHSQSSGKFYLPSPTYLATE